MSKSAPFGWKEVWNKTELFRAFSCRWAIILENAAVSIKYIQNTLLMCNSIKNVTILSGKSGNIRGLGKITVLKSSTKSLDLRTILSLPFKNVRVENVLTLSTFWI